MRNKRKTAKKDLQKLSFRQSIFGRLLLTMVGLLVSILVIFTVIQIQSEKDLLVSKSDEQIQVLKENLKKEARILSSNLGRLAEDSIASYDFFTLFGVVQESVDLEPNLSYAILVDASRHAFLHTDRPDLEQETLEQPHDLHASSQEATAYHEYELNQIKYMEYIYPVKVSTSTWGHLRLGFSLMPLEKKIKDAREEIDRAVRKIVYRSLIVSGLFIIFGMLVVYFLSKRISKPIRLLTKHADELADGNYWFEPDKSLDTNDEVGKLSDTFSLMADNIRKANEQLEDYNKTLESRVKEKSEALAAVQRELSHLSKIIGNDFKLPLKSMQTVMTSLKKDSAADLDATGKKRVTGMLEKIKTMHAMVNGILQYAEAGQLEGESVQIDLNKLVQGIISKMAIPKHVSVSVETKLPVIEFEKQKMALVFQHLLSNAVAFNDKEEGLVTLGCKARGEFWEFYITDNGPGIPLGDQKSVFVLFKALVNRSGHVGVGLSVSKKIIESYQGKIWIDPETKDGTTIKFMLPQDE